MENKTTTDVYCEGRMPDTRQKCGVKLYQSDGEYLLILGNKLNPDLNHQRIECDNCGYIMTWKRNEKFIRKQTSVGRRQLRSGGGFRSPR